MIEFIDLTHRYHVREREITALEGIDLTVSEGEFVIVLGRNGSGKSTLVKHINGLLLPSAGEVKVDERSTSVPEDLSSIRQLVGMVFQNPESQIIAMMVEEDVAFGPENLGLPREEIRRRVDEALKTVGLEGFSRREPHLLSAGQKQKVAIAGVLAMKPKYLVLDEPTSMLDPAGRQSILGSLHLLNHKQGMAIIHVTQFTAEALGADRVIVLDKGKIAFDGRPEEILGDHQRLDQLGLNIPPAVRLARLLEQSSVEFSRPVFSVEEMVSELCRSN